MTRKLTFAFILVAACAGVAPVQAAPSPASFTVHGNVSESCSSTVTPASNTIQNSANSGNGTFQGFNTVNFTLPLCNGAAAYSLTLKSTALRANGTSTTDKFNYTATLTGWPTTGGTVSVTTTETSSTPDPPQQTYSNTVVSSAFKGGTVTVTGGTTIKNLAGTVVTRGTPGTTYKATVSVVLNVTP